MEEPTHVDIWSRESITFALFDEKAKIEVMKALGEVGSLSIV
jgi:hypothetical protein